ncbi:MAG: hypothetical protein ABIS14_13415 [Sphingomonas sp.]
MGAFIAMNFAVFVAVAMAFFGVTLMALSIEDAAYERRTRRGRAVAGEPASSLARANIGAH